MITPLRTVRAELIIDEITTEGSGPLRVLADDGNLYIAKTTTSIVPCVEVINEVLCGYLARCWNLAVPPFALVQISSSLVADYERRAGQLSVRYAGCPFNERLFFGSQVVDQIEVESYLTGPHHPAQMQLFSQPLDLLKIGVFDLWVGNADRKPVNPNILLGNGADDRFDFHPIDHTAAFGYLTDYRTVRDALLIRDPKNCILSTPFVRAIAKFMPPKKLKTLRDDIQTGMGIALANVDGVVAQVPAEWGLSKKAKAHLKRFFADPVRNERIARSYFDYIH